MDHRDIETRVLRLAGTLTLTEAESIHAALRRELSESAAVTVDVSGATEVDVSFVQLLLAARRTAADWGKSIALSSPADGALLDTLVRGGFMPPTAERMTAEHAFWSGKASEGK